MPEAKSVEDRFKQIEDYCEANRIGLALEFDHTIKKWIAWDDQEQLTDTCDSLGELAEALEAEFSL